MKELKKNAERVEKLTHFMGHCSAIPSTGTQHRFHFGHPLPYEIHSRYHPWSESLPFLSARVWGSLGIVSPQPLLAGSQYKICL